MVSTGRAQAKVPPDHDVTILLSTDQLRRSRSHERIPTPNGLHYLNNCFIRGRLL